MLAIEVVIPTRNRLEKLSRAIASIPTEANGLPVVTTIICDGDKETAAHFLSLSPPGLRVYHVAEHRGAVYCRNLAIRLAQDAVLYATDDIEFETGAIEQAARTMAARFPDDDGVVGFAQTGNGKYSPAGVAIVGAAFLARYPKKDLFYPGYYHFACQEVYRAAMMLDRFIFDEQARLQHFHPSFDHQYKDGTHVDARRSRGHDRFLSSSRQGQGLTWGIGAEAAR